MFQKLQDFLFVSTKLYHDKDLCKKGTQKDFFLLQIFEKRTNMMTYKATGSLIGADNPEPNPMCKPIRVETPPFGNTEGNIMKEFPAGFGCSNYYDISRIAFMQFKANMKIRDIMLVMEDNNMSDFLGIGKNQDMDGFGQMENSDVGMIQCQKILNTDQIGRIAFYNREGRMLTEIVVQAEVDPEEYVIKFWKDQKLAGLKIWSNGFEIEAVSFIIAACTEHRTDKDPDELQSNAFNMCYDMSCRVLREKYGLSEIPLQEEEDYQAPTEIFELGLSPEDQQHLAKKKFMSSFRSELEKDQIADYLQMIQIFTTAAQKAHYPLEMLSNVANPDNLMILFELIFQVSPLAKLSILAIIKNLVKVDIPDQVFEECLDKLDPSTYQSDTKVTFSNRLVQFLYNLALKIRLQKWDSLYYENEGGLHNVSVHMLQIIAMMVKGDEISTNFMKLFEHFENDNVAHEIEMLFELVGSSMQTVNPGDQLIKGGLAAKDKEMIVTKTCANSLKNNEDDGFAHYIQLKDSLKLEIHLSQEVCHCLFELLQRQPGLTGQASQEQIEENKNLNLIQAQICKYFILHMDDLPEKLSAEEIKHLSQCLYKVVNIQSFIGPESQKEEHKYAPWLFENAFSRGKALKVDSHTSTLDEQKVKEVSGTVDVTSKIDRVVKGDWDPKDKSLNALKEQQEQIMKKMELVREFMMQTGSSLPEIVLALDKYRAEGNSGTVKFTEELREFVDSRKENVDSHTITNFIVEKCADSILFASKEDLEGIVRNTKFSEIASQFHLEQLLIQHSEVIKPHVFESIEQTLDRFVAFKANNKVQAMEIKGKYVKEGVKFKSNEISKVLEDLSEATLIHFLNNQLKRKLLNKLIYKFAEKIIDENTQEVPQGMINTSVDAGASINGFKLLWFTMQHLTDQEMCREASQGIETVWEDPNFEQTTEEDWQVLLDRVASIPETGPKMIEDLIIRIIGIVSQETYLFVTKYEHDPAEGQYSNRLHITASLMCAKAPVSILKTMKLLEQVFLMFIQKHDKEDWHMHKLEMLFRSQNDGPSIFASLLQVYLNLIYTLFEFIESDESQVWLRRTALEACFRLTELARSCKTVERHTILEYSLQPLIDSKLFVWLAEILKTRLGESNILQKDIFFYLSADFVCNAVKTYISIAKQCVTEGLSVKVSIDPIFLEMAKSVNRAKILPDRDQDLSNSLVFLKEVLKNQINEENLENQQENILNEEEEKEMVLEVQKPLQQFISPDIAFQTEYEFKVRENGKNRPSFLYASIDQGEALFTRNQNQFNPEVVMNSNHLKVQWPPEHPTVLACLNINEAEQEFKMKAGYEGVDPALSKMGHIKSSANLGPQKIEGLSSQGPLNKKVIFSSENGFHSFNHDTGVMQTTSFVGVKDPVKQLVTLDKYAESDQQKLKIVIIFDERADPTHDRSVISEYLLDAIKQQDYKSEEEQLAAQNVKPEVEEIRVKPQQDFNPDLVIQSVKDADQILVLYSVAHQTTFDKITEQILPLLCNHCKCNNISLVGTQVNERTELQKGKKLPTFVRKHKNFLLNVWNEQSQDAINMNIVKSIEEIDLKKQDNLKTLYLHTQHLLTKKINVVRNANDDATKLCVTTTGDVFSQPVNKQRKRWVNQGKHIKDKIASVSLSDRCMLLVTESGKLWHQGLKSLLTGEPDSNKKSRESDEFWVEAQPKVLKTWQVSSGDNHVAYAQCLQPDGLSKIYSIGCSELGFLGQNDSTESQTFLPLAYEAAEENQFEDIFLINTMVMARSTLGELWCLGGADTHPKQKGMKQSGKDLKINIRKNHHSFQILKPTNTKLMEQNNLKAVKVVRVHFTRIILAADQANNNQMNLYTWNGGIERQIKQVEAVMPDANLVDLIVAPGGKKLYLILDLTPGVQKVIDGSITGILRFRSKNSINQQVFIEAEGKDLKDNQFLNEVDKVFSPLKFEMQLSWIMNLLNIQSDIMKNNNVENVEGTLRQQLVECKQQLEKQLDGSRPLPPAQEENALLTTMKKKLGGLERKTVLNIDLAISVMKINETLRMIANGNVCLLTDPWQFDNGKLRENALTCSAMVNLRVSNNFLLNESMKAGAQAKIDALPTNGNRPECRLNRLTAHDFKYQGKLDHNESDSGKTIFTQVLRELKGGNFESFRKKALDAMAYHTQFAGERSDDWGGPFRDTLVNMCDELMANCLPVLIPTNNHKGDVGDLRHCYVLNHDCGKGQYAEQEMEMLYFFGILIGYGILSCAAIKLRMHPSFWKQVESSLDLTDAADLNSQDELAYSHIRDLKRDANTMTDEEFLYKYDHENCDGELPMYFVLSPAELGRMHGDPIELCLNGANRRLTPQNAEEFINLKIKAMLNQASFQMAKVREGIEFICGVELCNSLSWRYLEERCCGRDEINVELLKQFTNYRDHFAPADSKWRAWFWEIFEDMDHEDRELYLTFVNGRSKLPTDLSKQERIHTLQTSGMATDQHLPKSHTCFNKCDIPPYSTKQIMQDKLLLAIRLVGEIDDD